VKKIIIFGRGGQAKVVLDCIKLMKNHKAIGFISDKRYDFSLLKQIKYLGSIKDLNKIIKKYNSKNLFGIIAIGDNLKRKKILLKVKKFDKNFKWVNVIHPSVIISPSAIIGSGNMIFAGSIISTETKVHNHVCINTGSFIDHNNTFHNFSSTGPGVITGGNVTVGEQSFLGIGSVVKDKIFIGKNTVVGGKAFVRKSCKSNSVYYGVPAKRIKKRSFNEPYL
jgi:sugar O-acyltransferase (sialic acid O-acetyltransferase NeuD family)|tara:strand:- start:151 stop:819 length:669 start_codon:yes stop_codon:yes gene_type:complete